jgi:hypothetical protein
MYLKDISVCTEAIAKTFDAQESHRQACRKKRLVCESLRYS